MDAVREFTRLGWCKQSLKIPSCIFPHYPRIKGRILAQVEGLPDIDSRARRIDSIRFGCNRDYRTLKLDSIRNHLRPYSIFNKRRTTIAHAFASAIAVVEGYDRSRVADAIRALGQNPDSDLLCVYCGEPAQTWDHLRGLVKNKSWSGFGHTVANLVPCCKKCNSEKRNRDWLDFLKSKNSDDQAQFQQRFKLLNDYSQRQSVWALKYRDIQQLCPDEVRSLENARDAILAEMKKADTIAEAIRNKVISWHRTSLS